MTGPKRAVLRLAILALPGLLIYQGAMAQTAQPRDQTTGAAPRTEERLVPQAPVGHRQPRAADIPNPPEKTAADRERERKDRELDKRLRICSGC
jgi:hypothetical protein